MILGTILAQVNSPGPTATGGDLMRTAEFLGLVIAPIVSAVIAWKVATRKKERRKIEPDPLRVRKVSEKATEENCKERFHDAMDAIEALTKENDIEHRRLYDQIDLVERRGEDSLKASMAAINATFRSLPGEVIKLLKDTGQLKDHNRREGV